jgi:hypothetical protein
MTKPYLSERIELTVPLPTRLQSAALANYTPSVRGFGLTIPLLERAGLYVNIYGHPLLEINRTAR